ncbi:MAG: HAD hydrolase-like protein [Verrucomicrobiales bacterium]|nr:HAD hydrolase-like protein [Verrucomicrobiales bacterium]
MEKLLLFDIDGTLIDTEGAGLISLQKGMVTAFPELSGRAFPPLDLGGATDSSVVAFLFEAYGLENHFENQTRFFDFYLIALKEQLQVFEKEGKGRVLDGVVPLLQQLATCSHRWTLALLTGNTAHGARAKLSHYGVDHHFAFGAYGDDHADRNELGPIALRRAEKDHGLIFDSADVVVIGDTPKDVACARAFGARVIAVATGASSHQELAGVDPDILLKNFEDTDETLAAIEAVFG